jgi:hypothetical protein
MTAQETAAVLAVVRVLWPHSVLGDDARTVLNAWHLMLESYGREDVEHAIRELATTRDHAPGPGVVARVASERAVDAPDWDVAWAEVCRLIRSHGRARTPSVGEFSHDAVAAFALPAWRELCDGPAPGTREWGTHYAQQREAYRALRARGERGAVLRALGAPRRRGELSRVAPELLAPLRALPGGAHAA